MSGILSPWRLIMAFHKIGNSIYSDDELRSRNEEVVSIVVPAALTALGVYYLHAFLSVLPFFIQHTTSAKLIYVVAGMTLFCLGYTLRKLIVSMIAIGIAGLILVLVGMALWQWLSA